MPVFTRVGYDQLVDLLQQCTTGTFHDRTKLPSTGIRKCSAAVCNCVSTLLIRCCPFVSKQVQAA